MALSETGKELRELLESIYNSRDFVIGVMSITPENKWQKVIDFINYEKEHGKETNPDDISLLAIVLKKEQN